MITQYFAGSTVSGVSESYGYLILGGPDSKDPTI